MKVICLVPLLFFYAVSFSQNFEKLAAKIHVGDSVFLATDVYKPKGEGTRPAILIRTPYNKEAQQPLAAFFCENGYVVVVQDVRGKYKSTGVFVPFINEVEDGKKTLDWITQQTWSNRSIGMYGSSYAGFCALSLSDGKHPSLKTIFNNGGWLRNQNVIEEGGATNLLLGVPWTYTFTRTATMRRPNIPFDSVFKILPVSNMLMNAGFQNWWTIFDTLLSVNKNFNYGKVTIPVMHITGWLDFTMKGTMDFYQKVGAFKNSKQKLVVGPWAHGQNYFEDSTIVGTEDFGVEAKYGQQKLNIKALEWFNAHLKSSEPVKNNMELFVLFLNKWITVPTITPGNIKDQHMYFSSEKSANSKFGDGQLIAEKGKRNGLDTFTYDPLKPVPTNGGANFHFFPNYLGVRDQNKLQERKDLLVYISEPMKKNTMVVGTPSINLYVSSSATSTDFVAKLFVVDPTGARKLISDGIKRIGSVHKSLKPGKVVNLQIDLGPAAFYVKAGWQVGIEISGSNFPKFDRNLNTIKSAVTETSFLTAKQTIYHGKSYPSVLILPIYNAQ